MMVKKLTFGEVIRSILYNAWFALASVGLGLVNIVLSRLPDKRLVMANCELWSAAQRWGVRRILGIELVIEGEIPKGRVFVAIKHESMFEAVDLPTLLYHPAIFAKVELLRLPAWGRAAARYGLVPVERDQGAKALRAMLAAAREFSSEDRPLAIFPEGTRVGVGEQPELRSGFIGLYKLIGLPVVPIAVNSGALMRGFWKRRGVITYRIGEVVPAGLPKEEMIERVHKAINVLNVS
jgi:1-acyl-sn-glycerol-3-phosphate acyltransferase